MLMQQRINQIVLSKLKLQISICFVFCLFAFIQLWWAVTDKKWIFGIQYSLQSKYETMIYFDTTKFEKLINCRTFFIQVMFGALPRGVMKWLIVFAFVLSKYRFVTKKMWGIIGLGNYARQKDMIWIKCIFLNKNKTKAYRNKLLPYLIRDINS